MQHFFDDQIDIDWVFKVHLKAYNGTALHLSTNCIIIEGNEDSPDKVELFSVNHYMATPVVFIRSEDTGLLSDCNTVRFIYRVDSGDNV